MAVFSHCCIQRIKADSKWNLGGLLPEEKPELQRFLEQRRLEQHREREQALKPLSDLEQELCKRRQKLMAYEQEELRRREDLEKMPELVRMRNNLRHISISGC
ncbi:uncharacterized protein LOC127426333 isoform X2 [Myxocyprinus asiaticus]|uniref:uncharacterized protein LOC127426333 isoform X2 n=1 Tax=Myxocyprinus asiaticus TaxID=70543 RepID=UPI00222295E7|nr:uncharacterized protein LOC127426333 isoform X2 [Myxocyprinus asiaticus]